MSLTVREALRLHPLSLGRLVAGADGLDNEIHWVTIVEVLEDADLLREGELLVTTAYGLEHDTEARRTYISRLAGRRQAALVVVTGYYLHEIPAEMISQADAHGLPVIQIPSTVTFSDITHSLLAQIVNEQYQLLHASENVHRELTALALGTHGLGAIASVLARWTGGQVHISDPESQPLYEGDAPPGGVDAATCSRLAMPIRANGQAYGQIMLTKAEGTIRELDRVALGHAATVAALLFVREQAVVEAEQRLRGNFLDQVLAPAGPVDVHHVVERARSFGCDFTRPHVVLAFRTQQPVESATVLDSLRLRIDRTLQAQRRRFLLRQRSWGVQVLLEAESTDEAARLAAQVMQRWGAEPPGVPLQVGVGNVRREVAAFALGAREAEEAARLGPLFAPRDPVILYHQLGIFHVAAEMERHHMDLEHVYRLCLGQLADDDERLRTLLGTLETYLAHNGNLQSTAEALFIHRHTLRYRLQRIEQITGRAPDNPMARLQFHIGIALRKYVKARVTRPH